MKYKNTDIDLIVGDEIVSKKDRFLKNKDTWFSNGFYENRRMFTSGKAYKITQIREKTSVVFICDDGEFTIPLSKFQLKDFCLLRCIEEVEFNKKINKLKEHLSSLHMIRDNWISGGSAAPTKDTCARSANFLVKLEEYLFSTDDLFIPEVIIGPIPCGGVGIEVIGGTNKMILSFYNNSSVEVSIGSGHCFDEFDMQSAEFNKKYRQLLGKFLKKAS